jgi:DNA modification methylase
MNSDKSLMRLADLHPHPQNPNRHTPQEVALIRQSLHKFGVYKPLVVWRSPEDSLWYTLTGHCVAEAAAQEGMADVWVEDRSDLTPTQAMALMAGDNEIARQLSYADQDDLSQLIAAVHAEDESLAALAAGGEDELRRLLEMAGEEPRGEVESSEDLVDKAAELQVKWRTSLGQLWALGKHRLLIGDSAVSENVARLMGESKAILFATDPPYGANAGNIGFTAQRDDIEAITKDDLEGHAMQSFLEGVFRAWIPHLTDNAAWYLWHPMLTQGYFAAAAAAAAADLIIHRQIIWKKEQFIFGRGDYHWRHELCFYGWRKGHRPPFYGERNQDTVWEVAWGVKRGGIGHPTAKPPELFAIPMRNHTKLGDICAEPFAGSGSQFVAGELSGRMVYGMEIEPKWAAIILERWAVLTGQQPQLI